jgi:hypothetical protein
MCQQLLLAQTANQTGLCNNICQPGRVGSPHTNDAYVMCLPTCCHIANQGVVWVGDPKCGRVVVRYQHSIGHLHSAAAAAAAAAAACYKD